MPHLNSSHYALPLIPDLEGMDVFKGEIIHSHSYRFPETYSGKTVVCLGAAASGQDISLDIASGAKKVCFNVLNIHVYLLKIGEEVELSS